MDNCPTILFRNGIERHERIWGAKGRKIKSLKRKIVKKFEKTDVKHKKALIDLQFLKNCEDHNVIPMFSRFIVANATLRTSLTYKRCQKKSLLEEIYNKKVLVSQLDRDSTFLYKNVTPPLNIIVIHHVLNISLMSSETN